MGFDLLVKNATLPDGGRQDIGVVGERIVAVGPNLMADAGRTVDAATYLVSPPFVNRRKVRLLPAHSDLGADTRSWPAN